MRPRPSSRTIRPSSGVRRLITAGFTTEANVRHRIAVVLGVLSVAVGVTRTSTQPMPPPADPAVRLLRAINTAEADARRGSGRYSVLADALTHPLVAPFAGQISSAADEVTFAPGQPVPERRLSLVVSGDGVHYALAVVPVDGCGPAWFTSERGLIYQARALGCPA